MINIQRPAEPDLRRLLPGHEHRSSAHGLLTRRAVRHLPRSRTQDYQGHEICLGSNETALSIADVTDKSNPVAVSMASYPNVGYSHQGWLSEDHRLLLHGRRARRDGRQRRRRTRTLIWDLADLDDPVLARRVHGRDEGHGPQPLHPRQHDVPVELQELVCVVLRRHRPREPGARRASSTPCPTVAMTPQMDGLVVQLPVLRERQSSSVTSGQRGSLPRPVPPADHLRSNAPCRTHSTHGLSADAA